MNNKNIDCKIFYFYKKINNIYKDISNIYHNKFNISIISLELCENKNLIKFSVSENYIFLIDKLLNEIEGFKSNNIDNSNFKKINLNCELIDKKFKNKNKNNNFEESINCLICEENNFKQNKYKYFKNNIFGNNPHSFVDLQVLIEAFIVISLNMYKNKILSYVEYSDLNKYFNNLKSNPSESKIMINDFYKTLKISIDNDNDIKKVDKIDGSNEVERMIDFFVKSNLYNKVQNFIIFLIRGEEDYYNNNCNYDNDNYDYYENKTASNFSFMNLISSFFNFFGYNTKNKSIDFKKAIIRSSCFLILTTVVIKKISFILLILTWIFKITNFLYRSIFIYSFISNFLGYDINPRRNAYGNYRTYNDNIRNRYNRQNYRRSSGGYARQR